LKLSDVQQGHDLAWLDLPLQNSTPYFDCVERYGLKGRKYIALVPSGLPEQYTSDYSNYINCWSKLCDIMLRHPELSDHDLVLMPHVFKAVVDDRKIINAINPSAHHRVIKIVDELLPHECRSILAGCTFSIAGRMHAAISTIQTGKPSLALSYSVKYQGVIAQDAGLPELVLEARGDDEWQDCNIVKQVTEKIGYMIANYNSICNLINAHNILLKQDMATILSSIIF